eukprot:1222012-Heterocapsa_arctica.AAC.1
MLSNAASNFRLQESTAHSHLNNREAELNARAEQQSARDACRAELHAQEQDVVRAKLIADASAYKAGLDAKLASSEQELIARLAVADANARTQAQEYATKAMNAEAAKDNSV